MYDVNINYSRMCGIFALLNGPFRNRAFVSRSPYWTQTGQMIPGNTILPNEHENVSVGQTSYADIHALFMKGRARGPESSILLQAGMQVILGFHRLAINGLNRESDQPICNGDIQLICNGEIYNYRELYTLMDIEPTTQSDCEVIVHLYRRYGIQQTLAMLDGVFAFVLIDQSISLEVPLMYIARDPFGVRPLYTTYHPVQSKYTKDLRTSNCDVEVANSGELRSSATHAGHFTHPQFSGETRPLTEMVMFASELKMLYSPKCPGITPRHFTPGTFSEFYLSPGVSPAWTSSKHEVSYYTPGITSTVYSSIADYRFALPKISKRIRDTFIRAVEKRCITTERPMACLLSGGLDSSIVVSVVSNYRSLHGLLPVETYSIGLEGSEDLKYAKIVAEYLGTNHHEIVVSESDFLDAIPEVIYAIESYDTTTVRASIGNYLLGKYISKHSEAKVIMNGDGSDELMGGYLYMKACPDPVAFDGETRRLLREIHAFDVLRSDKSISSHGLEPRTPFLDREFVQMYLSIPPNIRYDPSSMEKNLFRYAFSCAYFPCGKPFLPKEILWRQKEAFSDGVSKHTRSLYEIIQEYTNTKGVGNPMNQTHIWQHTQNPPKTSEQVYYRRIFESHYHNANILPHFWMPRFVDATDASARTLSIYRNKTDKKDNDTNTKHVSFVEPT